MARPRKMTVEQMISVVDSYYLARAERNEKLLKCSLIAAYAVVLGYQAEGYDFARNLEVREHIERMKCYTEVEAEGESLKSDNTALSRANNKLVAENRYLRKMLRTYLYPAVANEILVEEGELTEPDIRATEKAVLDMAEFFAPLSLRESVAADIRIQSEEDELLSRMWRECDE